jgi:hypothetical protein
LDKKLTAPPRSARSRAFFSLKAVIKTIGMMGSHSQPPLQLEAVHSRHLYVEDQAGKIAQMGSA